MTTRKPLWTPSPARRAQAQMTAFLAAASATSGQPFPDYAALHRWSVRERHAFWEFVWDYFKIRGERGARRAAAIGKMPGEQFFPEARLNYAENILVKADTSPALIFRGEDRVEKTVSWNSLTDMSGRMSRGLQRLGLTPGDRVAAVVPNMPETIAAFLGANAMGAVWSSCSPDFGERGILDRFGQISPRVLVVADGYYYAGKTIDIGAKIAAVLAGLPSVERVIVIDYIGKAHDLVASLPTERAVTFSAFLAGEDAGAPEFVRLPFDHPIYILYSSGTTGIPKCIVHRAGGILLKHITEHRLHTDVGPDDRLFYFTTCGWMMWNWLVSGLATGASLLLYDGSPFHPSERVLFDFADAHGMTIFGTSAKYIDAVRKTGWLPKSTHQLTKLKAMLSTGSPLAAESFGFVYESIKSDIHLASISGGTDICGCFVAGNPLLPVWAGEIQSPTLGLDVDVADENGAHLQAGKGELVCRAPFPSMPVMFWNDASGEKYHAAYFSRFEGQWCHGDFAEWTEHGGIVIHGRSDATLNPGGVRIGTAEIYAQVEQIPQVLEALAIGQDFDGDVRVVLFVRLKAGVVLDDTLVKVIKSQIRTGASPRHVPAKIIAVEDIPRTKSGKITELAVRDVVHGREVKNKEALANPEALDLFRDLEELRR